MFKRFIFALTMSVFAAFTASIVATAAEDSDDVFLDEGDGDFAAVPDSAPAPAPAPVAQPAKTTKSAKPAAPAPGKEQLLDAIGSEAEQEVAVPGIEEPAPIEEPIAEPEPAKPTKAKKEKVAAAPPAPATSSKGKGHFLTTKSSCPMLREPASEETMLTVKAEKKIWVEDVDSSWVRAYNKDGEPGYVSKDCF